MNIQIHSSLVKVVTWSRGRCHLVGRNLRRHRRRVIKLAALVLVLVAAGLAVAFAMEVHRQIRFIAPLPTPLFEDRHGNYLAEGPRDNDRKGFWEVPDPLPPRITACLLAIEDKRFYQHSGVDTRCVLRAVKNALTFGPRQGASTIAMQVTRLQNPGSRTIWRKLTETVAAYFLVRRFGHHEVLRHYLCLVPQGNQIHGVAYAARRYFQKPLVDLSWAEAALLASLPKAPGSMNVYDPVGFEKASRRAVLVLQLLRRQGTLDEEIYQSSLRQLQRLVIPPRECRPPDSYHAILRLVGQLPRPAGSSLTRPIRTTLDLGVQRRVQNLARSAIADYRLLGAGNVAAIVTEADTGRIVAYVGSADYFDAGFAGSIDFAATPRQSGSTLKPFIYALGLAKNSFTPSAILPDLPLQINYPGGGYIVSNYDEEFLGPMLYRNALANSRNVPAVEVLKAVGAEDAFAFFQRLGLAHGPRGVDFYGLGMAIGGMDVTLEDLVAAYGVLASGGKAFSLKWFWNDHPDAPDRLLPEEVARQITLYLSDPLARLPSFARMGPLEYPFPVAVKTGTSQGFRDAWAVAFSARFIVGVWIGNPNNQPMNHVSGSAAAELVKAIMVDLHPAENRGVGEMPFPSPRGFQPVKVCAMSGGLAGEECPTPVLEYFRRGTEPLTRCTVHRRFAVDRLTGALAGRQTPPEQVVQKTFVVLPSVYASWGLRRGFEPPPVDTAALPKAEVTIREPVSGSTFQLDPETPPAFQTLALRASVTPAIPEVHWFVDGGLFSKSKYPYEVRWPLKPGIHYFQARFPRASVASDVVRVVVK